MVLAPNVVRPARSRLYTESGRLASTGVEAQASEPWVSRCASWGDNAQPFRNLHPRANRVQYLRCFRDTRQPYTIRRDTEGTTPR